MSLIHDKVTAIPDDPAFDVGSDEWNAEHKFPGAGAGEIVFVDGSGHAATDAGFTFIAGTLTVPTSVVTPLVTATGGTDLVIQSDPFGSMLSLIAGTASAVLSNDVSFVVRIGSDEFYMQSGEFSPGLTNSIDVGSNSVTWKSGYFGTSVIVPAIGPSAGELMTLPASNAAGVLTNDGNGNLSWVGV